MDTRAHADGRVHRRRRSGELTRALIGCADTTIGSCGGRTIDRSSGTTEEAATARAVADRITIEEAAGRPVQLHLLDLQDDHVVLDIGNRQSVRVRLNGHKNRVGYEQPARVVGTPPGAPAPDTLGG